MPTATRGRGLGYDVEPRDMSTIFAALGLDQGFRRKSGSVKLLIMDLVSLLI